MNWLKRVVAEKFDVQLEPETVERASRRERTKRYVWMVGSYVLAVLVLGVVWEIGELVGSGTAAIAILALVLLDLRLFSWGVDRFNLVVPWQFREGENR